ncbi:hypothetical protein ACFW04_014662 [Cataglyphis niger]
MNNAVIGKTMENMRNHIDVKLLTKWDGRYDQECRFSENLIAVELRKFEVKFNKPIYVGMCILDISKVCFGPRVLARHIDCKYVVVAFVETRVRTHLDDVSLPQVIVTSHYDTSSGKISSCWSMQFLDES